MKSSCTRRDFFKFKNVTRRHEINSRRHEKEDFRDVTVLGTQN